MPLLTHYSPFRRSRACCCHSRAFLSFPRILVIPAKAGIHCPLSRRRWEMLHLPRLKPGRGLGKREHHWHRLQTIKFIEQRGGWRREGTNWMWIPACAGMTWGVQKIDSRLRGNDKNARE